MFLFFYLFISNKNKSIVITPNNVKDILESDSNHPILTLFWSPYCGHCTKFKPTWYELTETSKFKSTIKFAEVNCVEHNSICKNYPISGYPNLLFITPSVQTAIKFKGVRSIQNIDKFIEEHYKYPLIMIEEGMSITKYAQLTSNFSIFHLQYKTEDSKVLSIFHALSEKYDDYGAKFFVTKTFTTQLEVYKNVDEHCIYNKSLTNKDQVNSFISAHISPILPQLSNSMLQEAYQHDKIVMIIFLNNKDDLPFFAKAIKQINLTSFSFAFSIENQANKTIKKKHFLMKNINITKYPSVVLINPSNGSFLLQNLDSQNLNTTINQIEMLNDHVLNGSIQWDFNGYNKFLDLFKIRINFMLENTSCIITLTIIFALLLTLSILRCVILFFLQFESPKFE